jgi:chromosome segregation ATPase
MTRKELEDLGLSKEQVDSVIKINGADIENAKTASATEIGNLKTEVSGLQTQVKDRDKQLETLKASAGDNEALTKQIADLQAENETTKKTHESEMNQLKLDFAVEKALTGANAKNVKAVKALLDLEDAKFDKDGNVKGLSEQIEKLTADEGTKFLFEAPSQQQNQQKFKGFQPGASTQQKPGTEVDPSKMNYDELCAYLAENPDAAEDAQ